MTNVEADIADHDVRPVVEVPAGENLTRDHGLFDWETSMARFRGKAFTTVSIGEKDLQYSLEPLLRGPSADGAGPGDGAENEQTIRFGVAPAIRRLELETVDGRRELPSELVAGGTRFFFPAVATAQVLTFRLPDHGDAALRVEVEPVRPWQISLVHHSHFDIGYTDKQSTVIHEQLSFLDSVLDLAEADPTDSPTSFRWSVESAWVLDEWIKRRSPSTVARFMEQVKRGRIEVTAMPFNLHTESCSTEELHGLLRYARRIADEYGLDVPVAYQSDVSGCVGGIVDALAQADVKYLSVAHNWAGHSVPFLKGGGLLPRLFRWQSPAGNSVLVWQTTSTEGVAYQEGAILGLADSIESVDDNLPLYLKSLQTHGYAYDDFVDVFANQEPSIRHPYEWNELHLRVMGRIADNCPPNRRVSEIASEWNQRWVYPQLKVSTSQEFFDLVEERHGHELETFVGDWNNWWADGGGAGARYQKRNREAQVVLPQVATIDALSGNDQRAKGFERRLARAWEAAELWDEHTWGAANPWTFAESAQNSHDDQWQWKAEKAIRSQDDARLLQQEVLTAFARTHGGSGDASLWVVNTTGRARCGVVSCFLPESLVHTRDFVRLIDPQTGRHLPFTERNQENPTHRDGGRFLEFIVDEVPAVGYRRFDIELDARRDQSGAPEIRTELGDGVVMREPASTPVWELENERTRVVVDPLRGFIRSIVIDGHELVNADSVFGFNSYVHDQLPTRDRYNHLSGHFHDSGDDLVLLAARDTPEHVAFVDAGTDEVSTWLQFRTFGVGVESVLTTLRLTTGQPHVDISNWIVKQGTWEKESGYFAFPFATGSAAESDRAIRYEGTGFIGGTDQPALPGSADHMFGVRDWATVHTGSRAFSVVTPDVPLMQFSDIALPFPPFGGTLPQREPGTIFSWLHNNIWDTNFPVVQQLDTAFRYRVSTFAAASPEEAGVLSANLADDLVRPLRAVAADPQRGHLDLDASTSLPGAPVLSHSLLQLSDDRVRLLSVNRASGGEMLLKLQSLAEDDLELTISSTEPVRRAWGTNLLGERREELPIDSGRLITLTIGATGTTAVLVESDVAR